uniref:putative protein PTGES3L isoform X1 n=1 Tax=Myxine glutinosa TaxID=7769 RepID=UPI00358F4E1B
MTEKNYLFVNFMIQDGKDIKVNLEDQKITFSGTSGADDTEYDNEIELYAKIVKADSQTKQYDRKVHCFMGKSKRAEAWPRLTKDPAKLTWLTTDFDNWRDWADENEEEIAHYENLMKTMKEISDKNKVVPSMDDLDDDLEEGGGVTASKQDGCTSDLNDIKPTQRSSRV